MGLVIEREVFIITGVDGLLVINWITYLDLMFLKANDGNLRVLATKTLSKRDVVMRKNNGRNVQFSSVVANASLEADVLDKDSAEAVNDKAGKHFFIFP